MAGISTLPGGIKHNVTLSFNALSAT